MMRLRFGLLAVLGVTLCLTVRPGGAEEPKPTIQNAERVVYMTRNVPPAELAKALNAHFPGAAEAVAVSEKTSNVVLIRVTPSAHKELLETLEKLDAKPATVEVEILVAEFRGEVKEGSGKIDEAELSGPADKVAAKVRSLQKAGLLGTVKQFQLRALENQRATARMGESRPFVVGQSSGFGGRGSSQQMINYRDLGTTLGIKPRVGPGGAVAVELELEDSSITAAEGASLGTDDNGKSIPATSFLNSRLQTTLRVPAGESVLAQGVRTEAKDRKAQTLIIVTARPVDAEKK